MKNLFFILLVLSSPLISAECNRKIDPKKVIIFIDTNTATPEIEKAEAGACARGQRLVVIPKNHREYDQLFKASKQISQELMNCHANAPLSDHCMDLRKKENKIGEKISKLKENRLDYPALLKAELEALKKSKSSAVSFIISGHDGGGNFGGQKGNFSRYEIDKIFKDYPEENKVESALLLGCYTGVKFEVKHWKAAFPNLRLLGGYDSSAPLSERPAGLRYIQELLTNEKNLLGQTDHKKLEKKLYNSIKSINELRAGIYIKPTCVMGGTAEAFYYGSQSSNKGLEGLVVGECEKPEILQEIREMEPRFQMYYTGELEPPVDTANGELRKIYNKARKLEHCLTENNSSINLSPVFNLLFFNGIKESFADFYKDDLRKAEDILKDVNLDDVIKNQEKMIKDIEGQLAIFKSQNEILSKTPEIYVEENKNIYAEDSKKYDQSLTDPAYASLLEKMPDLKQKEFQVGFNFYRSPPIPLTPEEQLKENELSTLKMKLNNTKYLIDRATTSPGLIIASNNSIIKMYDDSITKISAKLSEHKDNPSILKNVWVPTAENLKNKSRKEILGNIYKIYDLSITPGLPPKSAAALSWMGEVTNSHFANLQNPFSWHEYAEKVEAPPQVFSLQTALDYFEKNPSGYMGGGYMGGGFNL